MGRKLVFVGPSLHRDDKRPSEDVVFLPPAIQGSILTAVARYEPTAILLIDGGFEGVAAVRHKEILWAVAQGIPVMGAASMGALRAAELAPWMQGVGLIYRWYRRFKLAPDDAVAVQHGPGEVGFAAVTDALVDLRLTFRHAARQGFISKLLARQLETTALRQHFRDRTLANVVASVVHTKDAHDVKQLLSSNYVSQKRADALKALAILQDDAQHPAQPVPDLPITRVFAEEHAAALRL